MTEWERVIAFHGHPCCLLAIGYRAAKAALAQLEATCGEHGMEHGLIAVVENRTCAVDAVQILTGCTFGKRNLIFRDNGKYVFTFARVEGGPAVRVSLRPGLLSRQRQDFTFLMEKVANGTASPPERLEFYRQQEPLMQFILNGPVKEIFKIEVVKGELAAPPLCLQTFLCGVCGEEVMKDHAVLTSNGRVVCRDCI